MPGFETHKGVTHNRRRVKARFWGTHKRVGSFVSRDRGESKDSRPLFSILFSMKKTVFSLPEALSLCSPHRHRSQVSLGQRCEPDGGLVLTAAGPLVDLQQLHLEHERGVGRNDTAGSRVAVPQVRRNGKLAFPADLHPCNPLVPARNDVTGAERE